jgi:hypothetical protein
MLASSCSVANMVVSMPQRGVDIMVGCRRAAMGSLAAAQAASIDAVFGMGTWAGNHSRVWAVPLAPVSVTKTW